MKEKRKENSSFFQWKRRGGISQKSEDIKQLLNEKKTKK